MGMCRGRGFRGFLEDLAQAPVDIKKRAFDFIERGDTDGFLKIFRQYPGLLQQKSDAEHQSTILIAIAFQISHSESKPKRDALYKLMLKLLDENRENIDLTGTDVNKNTLLHRLFYDSIAATDEEREVSNQLLDLGRRCLFLIKDAAAFQKIVHIRNNHKETFIQNIYFRAPVPLSSQHQNQLTAVQAGVADLLNAYKHARVEDHSVVDFKAQSFKERLEESLTDIITGELMTDPLCLPEGQTMDASSVARLEMRQNDRGEAVKENPFTRGKFKPSEATPNLAVKKVLELFNQYKNQDESVLAKKISDYFSARSSDVSDDYSLDLLTQEIITLTEKYRNQSIPQAVLVSAAAGGPAPVAPHANLRGAAQAPAVNPAPAPHANLRGAAQAPAVNPAPAPHANLRGAAQAPAVNPALTPAIRADLRRAHLRNAGAPAPIRTPISDVDFDLSRPRPFGGYAHSPSPDQELFARISLIQKMIHTISDNIHDKTNGRASWFTLNTDTKLQKLTAMSAWINTHPHALQDKQQEEIILAVIEHICSIKRNSFGLFAPHSLNEFHILLQANDLQASNKISLTNEQSLKLDNVYAVDDLMTELFRSHGRPALGAY